MSQATMVPPPAEPMDDPLAPEPLYEVVNGQRVELPSMGTPAAWVASNLCIELGHHVKTQRLGTVVQETLFILRARPRLERRPDLAFASAELWPLDQPLVERSAWDLVPDLAVEVNSPTDRLDEVLGKIHEYFECGVGRVWLIVPSQRVLYAYESPTNVKALGPDDELDAAPLIPGFRVRVGSLFPGIVAAD